MSGDKGAYEKDYTENNKFIYVVYYCERQVEGVFDSEEKAKEHIEKTFKACYDNENDQWYLDTEGDYVYIQTFRLNNGIHGNNKN